jgi:ABC-type uncharacterized transport system involved in gliding motility auxiliary subunit
MRPSLSQQTKARFEGLLFHLLLALAVGLAGWLCNRYQWSWDWSDNARNSLTQTSQQLLSKLEKPLVITSFTPDRRELRQPTREVVERYQRYRPDIQLKFVDPAQHPALTRELGIRVTGEMRLEYGGRSENLQQIDEQSLSNAIQRLVRQGQKWIVSLQGHGERRFDGQANHDLEGFGTELTRKGFRVQSLDLASTPQLPDNTGFLVIAGPRRPFLPREVQLLLDYLRGGGNLLWLTEPGERHGLELLAREIGLRILPGTVVDANGAELGLEDPAIALVPRYPAHPATDHFELITLFPQAAALEPDGTEGDWKATPLLQTLARSWNETGPIRGNVGRDAEQGEKAGPLTIGIAFSRPRDQGEQRLLVIGDGDFLTNAFLGNGGNLDLGLNLVRWLTGDDRLIDIQAKTSRDLSLSLPPLAGAIIGLGFLFALPLGLAAGGALVWWRRRNL